MNPAVIRQNGGVAFKTTEKYNWFVAMADNSDEVIGFIPARKKSEYVEINNYWIKDRDASVLKALVKEALKTYKKEFPRIVIIAQKEDYPVIKKLRFSTERKFVQYTRFTKKT
jgi:hypothetical protein